MEGELGDQERHQLTWTKPTKQISKVAPATKPPSPHEADPASLVDVAPTHQVEHVTQRGRQGDLGG